MSLDVCPCSALTSSFFLSSQPSAMLPFSSLGVLSPVLFSSAPSQPHFCFFYHPCGLCRGTACPARPSAPNSRSGLASLLLTGDTKESRRTAVTASLLPQFCMNRPPKERERFSSISCSYPCWLQPFQRQTWGKQSGTQRSALPHAGK